MNFQKIIIFLWLLLDVIGIAIIIPAFPELVDYYGVSQAKIMLWLTVYSLFAFLSAPVLGQLSDKYGRKRLLAGCIFGTFLSTLILLLSRQYRVFLLSRIVNGITGGNISILQAILTDISPDEATKSKNYGLMGALFGLGFIIWPVIWSLILKFGHVESIFKFSVVFALIEFVLIAVQFRNTNIPQSTKILNFNSFSLMWDYFKREGFRVLLISMSLLGIGWFMIHTGLSFYMKDAFNTSGAVFGYYLWISGLLSALTMGYLTPKFWTKRFSHRTLFILAHTVLILGYLLIPQIRSERGFLLLFYSIVLLSNYYMTVYNIELMSKADPNEIGEVSGMLGGAQSLFMFVGPLLASVVVDNGGNIFYGAVVCFAISAVVMFKRMIKE